MRVLGCFIRNDGDHKLIGVLPARPETDFAQLPEAEKAALRNLYPRVGAGEGWFGAEKAAEVIAAFEGRRPGLFHAQTRNPDAQRP